MMHLRPTGSGGPFYSPLRDITFLYPEILKTVERLLLGKLPAELEELMAVHHVSVDDAVNALAAYATIFELAAQAGEREEYRTVQTALAKSGFLSHPPAARIVVMYLIGTVTTGTFYGNFLDTVLPQTDPHGHLRRAEAMAVRLQEYVAAGPLQRWWLRLRAGRRPMVPIKDPV